ncbi:hypothetical protein K3163_12415 [Qipengyuania sp. 1NDW9]|uniref:hypothetical protein n=1 Tax=Qipengyuania xiapuensis TaxID=2867236 RepID=UPI001C86B18E|nr:hypothetical protein [Qipengyuania xiapuensis]MBX7494010.1 hypothetical protein [Qipengyuania xiapuensis]
MAGGNMDNSQLQRDARFLRIMAIVLLVMTVAAFAPRYVIPLTLGTYDPPASWNMWMHPHAIAGFGFSLLFIIQPSLIAREKFAAHRALGWVGAGLVLLSVFSGVGVQLGTFPTTESDVSNIVGGAFRLFQSLPLMLGFFVAAVWLRKRTDWHWRFMYMAAYAAVGTIIGRLFLHFTPIEPELIGALVGPANLAFVLVLPISDKLRLGKVHKASWISLAVFIAFQAVVAPFALSETWMKLVT